MITESTRWLFTHGKSDVAWNILCNMAEENGRELPQREELILWPEVSTLLGGSKDHGH